MFKKLLSTLLTALLIATALPILGLTSLAADSTGSTDAGEGNGADAIANTFDATHLVVTNDLTDDGKIGIPVTIKTYADKTLYSELGALEDTAMPTTASGRKYEVIVYIIGHNEERIGQESDVSILTDYLSQGYVVVVLDYKYHDLAIASQLEYSIQNIRKQIQTNGSYLGDDLKANRPAIKKDCNFALPAGCRLARNIVYYNLLENGIAGTAEQIVKCWNDAGTSSSTFKNAKASQIPACEYNDNTKGVWYEATSVEQLVRPDPVTGEAIPLDFNLYMDIIYPSNPSRETPVYMLSSSHEQREGETVGNGGPLHTGLLLRGFSTVAYDHEYFPMARDDHYGYFIGTYGYGMARQIGVKTHSAAVRCARYHAAELGYSEYDGYSVGGGSKASYCSILGSDEPNDRAELASFGEGPFNTTDYTTAGQPWLTYGKDSALAGQRISARVQGVVTFMGDGTNLHADIVNEGTSPTVIACGINDQFGAWGKWPACQETYMNYDVPHLAMSMYDRGHAWPAEIDSVLRYDRSQAMIEFLYYWANTENVAPRVIYTSPYNGDDSNKNEDPIVIHFAGDIPLTEIQNKVTVIDTSNNNQVLTGTWTASAGNNKFEFVANQEFVNGHTYEISIPATVTDSRGVSMEKAVTTTFASAADVKVPAIKDAYIISGSSVNTGSESTVKLSGSTSKGYLEFDISSIKESTILTRLSINVENDATNTVQVYALAEDAAAWAEDTIVWDNAPEASTLIGTINVAGAGEYKLDITDYVAGLEGNTVRLVLVNKFNSAEVVYDQSFDDVTSFVKGTNSDAVGSYSETYDYRQGGAPASFSISSDEDHTTGSGKSFVMVRKNDYDRFKLYNTIKSGALTEDDIGKTFRATFWVKTDADITVTAGLMMPQGTYGTNFCGTTSTTKVPANTWTRCELVITLTEDHVTNQAAMLTVQGTGTSALYVDDVHVETPATDVIISSAEGSSAPTVLASINKGVAAIGKVQYETFDAAMQAVPTDGTATTITLFRDVTLSAGFTVASGMDLTIDLGGHTMSGKNLALVSGATAPIAVRGSLTLKNGTLDISTTATSGYYGIHVFGTSSATTAYLELEDGFTFKAVVGSGAIQLGNNTYLGSFISNEGVSVDTSRYLVYAYGSCPMTIYGGTYEDTKQGRLLYLSGTAERTIYGGTFISNPTDDSDKKLFALTGGLMLMGGTYNELPADSLIDEDHEIIDNGDGTYTVREIPRGLMIGDTNYATIEAAMAAVPTDGTATTITLLDNVTTTSGFLVKAGMNLTVDLAGYTFTVSGTAQPSGHYASIGVKGVLKIGNGTLVIDGAKQYGIHVYNTGTDSGAMMELLDGLTLKMINSVDTHGMIQLGNQTANSGEMIIHEGVTVLGEYRLFYAYTNSTFTIYGGHFENSKVTEMFYNIGSTKRVIYGGTFSTPAGASTYKLFRQGHGLVLYGGTYSEQPLAANAGVPTLGEDRQVVENSDGTYTIEKIRYVGEPVDFTYVSQAEPDKNFGGEKNVVLSGENGKNMMILAEFNIADLANMEFFRIPVCGDADQKISVAVIDGWSFDPTTVTYNNVQDKLWAELMTTEKAGKHIGRYTVGTTALTINADDILSKVTGDVFTLVLQADEKYVFSLDFNDRTEMTISEGATHGVIGNTNTLNVPYETTYMAARGGYTKGCTINFVSATDKNGQSSMMFRVTQGGQRYRFYNLLTADNLTVLDIGRQFRISFDVMTTVDTSNMLNAGLHCRLSGDGVTSPTSGGTDNQYANYAGNWRYYDNTISTTANTWTTASFDIIIDETMVNHQIGMLCLNFGNIGSTEYFYIDNIKAEEISGNASATSVSFKSDFPVAFVDDQQITLGDKVTIIETNVKIGELDTDATTTKLIADGNNVLLAVDNKTGNLFFKKDGTSYVLCDAKGNAYTVSSDSLPVAAIIDKAAGTVRYAVGGKLAYYLDGGVAVNTYGTVIASSGFGATVTAGALGNAHGAVDAANTTSSTMTTDTPFIVGSQMSTVNNSVRVLSGINSLYYSEIGFRAVRGDGTVKEWKTAVVFTSVNALGESETAESLGCKYLSGFIVNGLEEAVDGDIFTVTPLVYIGEQEIAGDTVTFTVAVENGMISVTSGN